MSVKRKLEVNDDFTLSVSSVLNRDTKQFGKKFLTDGLEDTAWNSDQGEHQWILCQFKNLVQLSELNIQFQGGFASKKIVLQFFENSQTLISETILYSEDTNLVQNFTDISQPNPAKIQTMMDTSRRETIFLISKVLSKYQWLLDAYNLDYFHENHWDKLPKKWQSCLEKLNQDDIPGFLCPSTKTKHIFPLDLLCLRVLSMSIRSKRVMAKDQNLPFKFDENESDSDLALSGKNSKLEFSTDHQLPVKPLKTSDHILCRRIKLKKRHEIERLCKLIPPLMKTANNCTQVVDCGSGQGHLDRILTFLYGYRVFSIESNCDNVKGASETDQIVLNALRKCRLTQMALEDMPTKVNYFLTNHDDIEQVKGNNQVTQDKHLLLGLHACGPLSNLIMEQFINNPDAVCLVLVCCCYMKNGLEKFPMSSFLQENISFQLSREAKELACHAIEKFLDKFDKKELDSLKVHGYRSCLELLINKYDPEKKHTGMRSVKIDSSMSFKDYAIKATRGLNVQIPEEMFESELIQPYLEQLERVVIFYSLRLLVAPLVELFILLDYQQYLSEHSQVKGTFLVPLFEPVISPRNLILIAHK